MVAGRLLCVRRGGAGVLRNRGAAVVGRAERHQWKRCACLRVPQRPSSTTACAQHRQARRQHHQPADDDVNKAAASSGPALHEAEEEDGGVRECIRSIVDNGEMKAVGVTPGLFTNMRLLSSDGFPVIEEEARAHMNALVREMKDNHSRGHHEKALESVDHISHVLCKVLDLCEFVLQVHPSAEYRDAAANSLYSLGHDMEVLNTDVELYQALKAFEDMPSAVEGHETQYTARSLLHDFEKCGIHLPDRERDMVVQRVVELEQLRHQVESQQMSSLGGADIISSRDVPHIPLALRSSLTALPNGDRVSVPYGDPGVAGGVLALSSDRRMRQRADTLRHHTDSDLDDTMLNMLKKRHELARLVGYEDSAHKELGLSMARTPTVAREFLNASRANLVPHVNKEMDQLLALAKDDGIHSLQQWDIPYYVQCLKQGHRAVHDASAYFTIGNCFAGIDYIIHRLFGLRLQPQMPAAGEVWHEDVIRFDVVSEDASGGDDVIGSLYCDLFMRVPKNTHPSHYTIRSGRRLRPINADGTLGEQEKPICALVCGFAPGASGLPYQQALSLFHEFGHALHSLLSDTMYQHVAGTRGSFDFAELPSSLFEDVLRAMRFANGKQEHTQRLRNHRIQGLVFMELVKGYPLPACAMKVLAESSGPNLLRHMGEVVVLDMVTNNFDRLPFIWTNFGNMENIMVQGRVKEDDGQLSIACIDQGTTCITNEKGRASYMERVRDGAHAACVERNVDSKPFKRLRDAILNGTGHDVGSEGCQLLMEGIQSGCAKLHAMLQSKPSILEDLLMQTGHAVSDFGELASGIERLELAFVQETASIICSVYEASGLTQ